MHRFASRPKVSAPSYRGLWRQLTLAQQTLGPESRRRCWRSSTVGSVIVAVAGAAVSPLGSAAPPLTARPSKLGLAVIAAVKEYNTASKGGLSDAKADAAWNRMHAKIRPLRESIEE